MLIDASIDRQRVWVIVDTGSEISVGNMALRHALEQRHRLGPTAPITMVSVTGGRITAEYSIARQMRIGDADINNLPIAFADVHPFRQLQLLDRPAILLGMDALQLFHRVSVDFANRRVRLLTPNPRRTGRSRWRAARRSRGRASRGDQAPRIIPRSGNAWSGNPSTRGLKVGEANRSAMDQPRWQADGNLRRCGWVSHSLRNHVAWRPWLNCNMTSEIAKQASNHDGG